MLNPEFFLDEELAQISAHARLLYQGLWGICDDNHATLPDRPSWIKAQIFPYEDVVIADLITELAKTGKIVRFSDGNNYFWFLKNFFKYQRVDKPSKPKYPAFKPNSIHTPIVLPEDSTSTPAEVKRSKDKRSSGKAGALQGKQWNILIDLWEKINPMYLDFYKNKTERAALEAMAERIGFDKLKGTIEHLPDIIVLPFAPKITRPSELRRDFGKLVSFYKQEEGKVDSKKSKVAFT